MTNSDIPADPLYQPMTEEERLAVRAELREWKRETQRRSEDRFIEGQKVFAQYHLGERQNALGIAADFQKIFVRFAFLLNGGAIVAILALVGTLAGKTEVAQMRFAAIFVRKLTIGLEFFVAGLTAAAIAAGIALVAWSTSAGTFLHAGHVSNLMSGLPYYGGVDKEKLDRDFDRYDGVAPWAMNATALMSISSVGIFISGAIKIAKAFSLFALTR